MLSNGFNRMTLQRKLRLIFIHIKRGQHTPNYIAGGIAIGTFVAFTPTMGFQMIIAVFFAICLKKSKILAAIAVWLTNPWTAIPVYSFVYRAGCLFLKTSLTFPLHPITLDRIIKISKEIAIPLCIGSVVVGSVAAIIVYTCTMIVIGCYRRK